MSLTSLLSSDGDLGRLYEDLLGEAVYPQVACPEYYENEGGEYFTEGMIVRGARVLLKQVNNMFPHPVQIVSVLRLRKIVSRIILSMRDTFLFLMLLIFQCLRCRMSLSYTTCSSFQYLFGSVTMTGSLVQM